MISENIKRVKQAISICCKKSGRPADDVRLICVTKEASVFLMEEALASGIEDFGENRVQDAIVKYKAIGGRAVWHLIGHLQTNKARDAVKIFSLIHSVDSLRLAEEIDKQAGKAGKVQDILIQVNVSGEESKFGVPASDAGRLIEASRSFKNLDIKGLMTIAPEVADPETVRPFFRSLREMRDSIDPRWHLSMGMSNDFGVAIEEGATLVRVGRAIFRPGHFS